MIQIIIDFVVSVDLILKSKFYKLHDWKQIRSFHFAIILYSCIYFIIIHRDFFIGNFNIGKLFKLQAIRIKNEFF